MSGLSKWWPWQVCTFLLTATLLSYLDRQALSVVAPVVSEELSLDNAQLGVLLSTFFYSYSLMHLVIGYLLDRLNIRYFYGLCVALWSVAQMMAGLARGFGMLCGARLALGAFEAAAQPGASRIIARIMPRKDRAFANGLMMSGGSIGAVVAPVLMIWLSNTIGWRSGFLILGAVGLVWSLAWIAWFRPPAEVLHGMTAGRELAPEDRWSSILRSPKFWGCAGGAAFAIPIIHISSAWIPTYFVQQWKLPLTAGLGLYLFIIYLGLDFGFIGGGALVTWLIRGGMSISRARKTVLAGAAALMLAITAAPAAPRVEVAVALVFLLNLGRAAYGAIFLAFNQDIAPGRVGLMSGMMGCIGAFSGALLVWAIGVLSKSSGFTIPFLMIGAIAILGVTPLLLVRWEGPSGD
jgi:ACS family hexuronate transporter-like MFS transporter